MDGTEECAPGSRGERPQADREGRGARPSGAGPGPCRVPAASRVRPDPWCRPSGAKSASAEASEDEIKASAKRAKREAGGGGRGRRRRSGCAGESSASNGPATEPSNLALAMREVLIRDTLSGEPRALDPSGEVGIYACGPTVYSRIHIGNARPFVVFSLFARFLRSEGYRARLVINVTDVNDKIYAAASSAGEPSGEFAARMARAYLEDTDRLGLGRPDAEPLATKTIAGIVALIGDLIAAGHAYESGGDVYFRVRSFGEYGKLSNRRTEDMDQGEESGSASLKEDLLDFALWKAHKPGEDHALGLAVGPRASRLAHRVLGDGRGGARRLLRDPRRRLGPRLPPPRERDRPVRGGGPSLCPDLDAQRDDRDRRGQDVEVGGQHLPALEALDRYGREAGRGIPDLGALPAAAGFRRRADAAGRGAGGAAAELLSEGLLRPRGAGGESVEGPAEQQRGRLRRPPPPTPRPLSGSTRSARRWRMTSTRPGRWPSF